MKKKTPYPYWQPNGREMKEARTLREMIQRCHNPNHKDYPRYGARGIRVHPRWRGRGGYQRFIEDVGRCPSPDHSIDRRDNDGHYEPGIAHWATRAEQNNNRSNTIKLKWRGIELPLAEWARITGIRRGTLYHRLFTLLWSVPEALTTPVAPRRSRKRTSA